MRRSMALVVSVGLFGCSSSTSESPDGSPAEASTTDGTTHDSSEPVESSTNDGGVVEADGGSDASDASDAAQGQDATMCPTSWLVPPAVDPSLTPDSGIVLLHAAGVGSQVYACIPNEAGASWSLVGPNAELNDCTGSLIGHHFPSEGGSAYPEWQTTDGTYVVGHKIAAVDGGPDSVQWLLLKAVDAGGTGTLSQVTYIQRLDTDGGLLAGDCDAASPVQVPYTADYFFYGP